MTLWGHALYQQGRQLVVTGPESWSWPVVTLLAHANWFSSPGHPSCNTLVPVIVCVFHTHIIFGSTVLMFVTPVIFLRVFHSASDKAYARRVLHWYTQRTVGRPYLGMDPNATIRNWQKCKKFHFFLSKFSRVILEIHWWALCGKMANVGQGYIQSLDFRQLHDCCLVFIQ